jgi:sulfur relay (sulfurtransferase) DsrC/TusE family protein
MTDAGQWNKEVAAEIAKEEGVDLTDTHYAVLEFIREKVASGAVLTIRSLVNRVQLISKTFISYSPAHL